MMHRGPLASVRAYTRPAARRRRHPLAMFSVFAIGILVGLPVAAQDPEEPEVATTMVFGGLDLLFAQPTGEFAENVESGWGAGIWGRLPFDSNDRLSLRLDLGVRYHGNGDAQYLRKGDIRDLPDGSVEIDPRHSDTNLWTYQLGISLGFGITEAR